MFIGIQERDGGEYASGDYWTFCGGGGEMNRAYIPKAKSDIHITPDRIWDIIQKKWGFKKNMFFDPCPINHTKDGLGIRWKKLNFVNPPYTLLREFVYYGIKEARFGKTSVFLLPSKTDQEWFHTLIQYDYEIIWIRKRLKFKNNKHASGQSHFLVMIDEHPDYDGNSKRGYK